MTDIPPCPTNIPTGPIFPPRRRKPVAELCDLELEPVIKDGIPYMFAHLLLHARRPIEPRLAGGACDHTGAKLKNDLTNFLFGDALHALDELAHLARIAASDGHLGVTSRSVEDAIANVRNCLQ